MFELGPRSESRLSFDFTRQPQSHAYTGRSGPSGLAWPFHTKSQTNKSVNSLPASKFRVVGRGGSGSKLRQVSLSSPIVVLEADISSQRQPLDHGTPFYRPTGRGGLGSLSTNPPTVLKPLKPPTAILDRFLRGRKQSQVQLDEQYRIHKTSPRRSQSLYYRPQQIQKDVVTGIPFFVF
jgi:hypothetical protein